VDMNAKTAIIFFFKCPKYNDLRILYRNIDHTIAQVTNNFLFGDENASNTKKTALFRVVTKFIRDSKRFR
jgi:hypothetical protein